MFESFRDFQFSDFQFSDFRTALLQRNGEPIPNGKKMRECK